jgi:hypothetical protein
MADLPVKTREQLRERRQEQKLADKPVRGNDVLASINKEIEDESSDKVCGKGNGKDVRPRLQLERWLRSLKIPFRVNDTKDVLCGKLKAAGVNV